MTNESLISFIHMYNSSSWDVPINTIRLSENVVFGKLWSSHPKDAESIIDSYNYYFIENKSRCVAVVFEMGGGDIHWLVLEGERGNGYLYNALTKTIFPHVFSDGRGEQYASADSEKNINYLLNMGFVAEDRYGKLVYKLCSKKISDFDFSKIKKTPITDDEFKILEKDLYRLAAETRVIRDRLECSYDVELYLEEIAQQIVEVAQDVQYECKNS